MSETKNVRALPEKYRRASNIHEGYEIRCTESSEHEWLAVKHVLRIYAPANIVSFTFDDGQVYTTDPSLEIMSRRPAGPR